MTIKELYIFAYGSLRDRSFEFNEDLNIVTGENEAGKSTLMSFIAFMLYGPDETSMKYVRATVGECGGRMTVSSVKGDLLIERRIASTESSKKVLERFTLYSLPSMKELDVAGQPGDFILGVSRAFFMGTSFVSQRGASAYDREKTSAAVQNILLSANEKIDTGRALRKIDETRKYFLHKRGRGGVIADAEDKVSALSNEKFLSEQARAELSRTGCEIIELKKKKEENILLLDALKKEKEARRQKERRAMCEEREALAAELDSTACALREAQSYVESNSTDAARARLRELDVKEKYASACLADAENDVYLTKKALSEKTVPDGRLCSEENEQTLVRIYEKAVAHSHSYKSRAAFCFVGAALCAVLAIVSALMQYAIVCVALICGIAVLAVFALVSLDKKKKEQRALLDTLASVGLGASASLHDIADIFARARAERSAYLELEKKKEEAESRLLKLKENVNDCRREIDALISLNKNDDDSLPLSERISSAETSFSDAVSRPILLKEECRHIKERIALLDRQIASMGVSDAIALEPSPSLAAFDNDTISRNAEHLSAERDRLSELISEYESRRGRLSSGIKSADELDGLIADAKNELSRRKEQYDIVLLAEEAIRYASENLRSSVTPSLIEIGDRLFSDITQEKYNRIGIDDTLLPSGIGKESVLSADALSYGTNEAMYIAFRLSLLLVLCRGELPVLLLDESFAHIDDGRTENALRVLAKSGAQSIVFTCSKREGELAEGAEMIYI